MDEQLEQAAIDYHCFPTSGKISVVPTKPLGSQRDLSLAYSPGVAAACTAIARTPALARSLTSRGNLVAVVTNGSAVLGLGNIGALAGKPVMEGKGCLFKKFAGIDVFDIELDESDPDKLVDIIAAMEPTFGGINLEDIQAPQCFYIEKKLRERMNIPVFHDDQHGTAIIVGAAVLNALLIVGKPIEKVKLVCSGAGAAAIACLDILVGLGLDKNNICVVDSKGVIYRGRNESMNAEKESYAQATSARTLADATAGTDIFLGLSTAGVLTADMVKTMAAQPIILALANPDPEIRPEDAIKVRPDAIIATGRSDYPNQVNNVLCFPFIFRGALDVGATTINAEMKLAALHAIAELARREPTDSAAFAYSQQDVTFGPDFFIPRPFDPRLITTVAPAVAKAAIDSGVATLPIADFEAYRHRLESFVYRSGNIMRPVFSAATNRLQRVVFAEGEDARVLRAAQIAVDERLAYPVLLGHPETILSNIRKLGLRLQTGKDIDIVANDDNASIEHAAALIRHDEADALICGLSGGSFGEHLAKVADGIGPRAGGKLFATMNLLMLPQHTLFICDTYINADPSAEQLAEIATLAASELRHFGIVPRIALVSHASGGSASTQSAGKVRAAMALLRSRDPLIEIDCEIPVEMALGKRNGYGSSLSGEPNLLVMPNLDAASITFNTLKVVSGDGVTVGPILLGTARPAHILSATTTVRGLVNMTALAAVQAASMKA
ncbi:MAG: NADP-dependent malic enzyme [Rhizobiales bacterium 62-47]|nr:NADP-dependent malic enzyme [Hyphomicrobiales bacterium]OJY10926.1 MAG: NADP-dependent malic enzyme [Rhizobiales bacterium 62-47]